MLPAAAPARPTAFSALKSGVDAEIPSGICSVTEANKETGVVSLRRGGAGGSEQNRFGLA